MPAHHGGWDPHEDLKSLNLAPPRVPEFPRAMSKAISFGFKAWLVWAAMCLIFAGIVVVIAIHFIAKFW